MSLSRIFFPVTSSLPSYMVAASCSAASKSCPHVLQTRSYLNRRRLSSKRELQTASHYRPHSLESFPPPTPRNTGIPDTSIAGSTPEVNNDRPPRITGQHEPASSSGSDEIASVSLPENEAQKSKPIAPSIPSPSSATPKSAEKGKRSKLKARKAAMTITQEAIQHLKELLNQPHPKLIRVGVKNRGCSGLAYHLEFVEQPGKFDEAVEQDGVKVLIDSKALFSIIGSEMGWQEDKLSARFVFKNPNIKEQCGCGESFMV